MRKIKQTHHRFTSIYHVSFDMTNAGFHESVVGRPPTAVEAQPLPQGLSTNPGDSNWLGLRCMIRDAWCHGGGSLATLQIL